MSYYSYLCLFKFDLKDNANILITVWLKMEQHTQVANLSLRIKS